MNETWGSPQWTGLTSRLEKMGDLLKQLAEIEQQETLKKLENLKRIAEKAKEVKERK